MAIQEESIRTETVAATLELQVPAAGVVFGRLIAKRSCVVTLLPGADAQPLIDDLSNLNRTYLGSEAFLVDKEKTADDFKDYVARTRSEGLVILGNAGYTEARCSQYQLIARRMLAAVNELDAPMICAVGFNDTYRASLGEPLTPQAKEVHELLGKLTVPFMLNAENTISEPI